MTNFEKIKSLDENKLAESLAYAIYENAECIVKNPTKRNIYPEYINIIKAWLSEEYVPTIAFPMFEIKEI